METEMYEERLTAVEDGVEKLSTQVQHLEQGQEKLEEGQKQASIAHTKLETSLTTKLDFLTSLCTQTLQAVGGVQHSDEQQNAKLKQFDEHLSDRMKNKWLPITQIGPILLWFFSEIWPTIKGNF